jgi:uncharacterized repeat protein (TIGR02059 family)
VELSGTVIDVRIILQAALKSNASGLLVCHNHPSGNLNPSESDSRITQKIKQAGGKAASIVAQSVTNRVNPPASPVYVSSAIENSTPSVLEMTYSLALANSVPAASAFSVRVNSAARSVNSVSISGIKVPLTLSSPIANGNVVTIAYTAPSSNPLQTPSGGQAVHLVLNRCQITSIRE